MRGLLLLSLAALSGLLLLVLMKHLVVLNVRRGRVGRLRRRERGTAYPVLSQRQQELYLLQQIVVIVQLEIAAVLEQLLGLFLVQVTQKLKHQSLVVHFLDALLTA